MLKLDDQGVEMIAQYISQMKNLHYLNLDVTG